MGCEEPCSACHSKPADVDCRVVSGVIIHCASGPFVPLARREVGHTCKACVPSPDGDVRIARIVCRWATGDGDVVTRRRQGWRVCGL